jgi:uncharacterized protein YdcH (DUF465 family)
MEQEKLRLQDEIKSYMERDKEHLQKHNTLYDEIQQVFFTIIIITSYDHIIDGQKGTYLT